MKKFLNIFFIAFILCVGVGCFMTANADVNTNTYACFYGTYLPAGNSWETDDPYVEYSPSYVMCTPCVANSYCPDPEVGYRYNYDTDQGITNCPSEYPLSRSGAGNIKQCYRNCTVNDVAHATNVTGSFYYNLTNACEPTNVNSCETGYHYVLGQTPVLPDAQTASDTYIYRAHLTWGLTQDSNNELSYGEWAATWSSGNIQGTIKGVATCNETWLGSVFEANSAPYSMTNTVGGHYCWCKPTRWTPYNENAIVLVSDWVFRMSYGHIADCAYECTYLCGSAAASVINNTDIRTLSHCEPNTINITWEDATPESVAANNAGSCTYGGTINTPAVAPSKRGYVFTGWSFDVGGN